MATRPIDKTLTVTDDTKALVDAMTSLTNAMNKLRGKL